MYGADTILDVDTEEEQVLKLVVGDGDEEASWFDDALSEQERDVDRAAQYVGQNGSHGATSTASSTKWNGHLQYDPITECLLRMKKTYDGTPMLSSV
jgi:hypothetical protein